MQVARTHLKGTTLDIITGSANIERAIKSINTDRTHLAMQIQQAAIAVINHAHIHGDVKLASDLCLAVGRGMRHEALRLYLSEFGPMVPNGDKETKASAPMKFAKSKRVAGEGLAAVLERAAAKAWYAFKTEQPAEAVSFAADLRKLLGRLEKAAAGGYVPTDEDETGSNFGTTPDRRAICMIPVFHKRRHNGKRSGMQLAEVPRMWKEFVTYEHSVERWYA